MGMRPVKPEGGYWPLGDGHPAVRVMSVYASERKKDTQRRDRAWDYGTAHRQPPGTVRTYIAGEWNGEPKRAPRKGEWYLSGDMAYRAPNDLSSAYYIARIVRVQVTTHIKVKVLGEV